MSLSVFRAATTLGIAAASTVGGTNWDTSNFFNWFTDELRETDELKLKFDSAIPTYLAGGEFVHTGPARFGYGKMKFKHMLDGYSKTNTVTFAKDGTATFSAKFLNSKFMQDSIQDDGIARGIFVGGITPDPHWGPTGVAGPNDNNYIKMRKIGTEKLLLADTMVATKVDHTCTNFTGNIRSDKLAAFVDGVSWNDWIEPLDDICMLGTMAHSMVDQKTGHLIGSMGCTNPIDFGATGHYHVVFAIDPANIVVRKEVAKIYLGSREPSYMHCLAVTDNYIVLIAEPLYMSLPHVLGGDALGEGGLFTNADNTIFQIIEKATGKVQSIEAPGFIYGHHLNCWEEKNGDISMDLTWYEANNMTTLGWFNRWFLAYIADEKTREEWPRAQVKRYTLKLAEGKAEESLLFADEKGLDDFETPKINENFLGKPYCIAYMLQFHSYDYNNNQTSLNSGPFGAVGIGKRNVCTGERMGSYVPNEYPSEVQFVADPAGKDEDDGVLLGIVFNGNTNSSYFRILDAKTMKLVAKADLALRIPFLVHSSFFPADAEETVARVEESIQI